jgi:hypothetical protein
MAHRHLIEQAIRESIEQAIRESIARDRIVTIDGDASIREALSSLADDSVETAYDRGPGVPLGALTEYWGTDDEGDHWRVHVRHDRCDDGSMPSMGRRCALGTAAVRGWGIR